MSPHNAVFYSSSMPADSGGKLILRGLKAPLEKFGLSLIVAPMPERSFSDIVKAEEDNLMRCAMEPSIAAAIIMYCGGDRNLPALQTLLHSGKPVVLLGREINADVGEAVYDFISPNDFDSASRVVAHLIAQGHRSIAHITNRDAVPAVKERQYGYENALETAGLPIRPELILHHEHDILGYINFPFALLKRLLALPEPPTAVFAVNDWVALNVLLNAHLMGLRLPRDLAVAGFDAIGQFRPGPPLLTSAEQPFEEMGRRAALQVQERLSGNIARVKRCIYLEAPLRVHESTNMKAAGGEAVSNLLVSDGAWRTRLIYRFICMNLAEDLTLERLSAVAKVSTRRLLADFQQYEQTSPMHALQEERMKRVRCELMSATPEMTITEIAYRWGIKHLSRFSSLYFKQYGELPSDTIRRAARQR